MNTSTSSIIRYHYEIELLEDLHAGSGLGSVWVDRTLARDRNGRPFIAASHVKGVWRDTMVRMITLGVDGFSEEVLTRWFGAAPKREKDHTIPKQGKLHCPQLEPTNGEAESLVWMQTARERHSRRPKEDTLRTTEYLPAGTQLSGVGYLQGSPEEFEQLRLLVARVDRYGGNRSRGDGRIRLAKFGIVNQAELKWPDKAPGAVRLLLRARAPVRVPRTGSPGNIIESDTRIPGRMLAGAIISPLIQSGAEIEHLFSGKVAIGDALPISPALTEIDDNGLKQLEVLPVPFEYRMEKHQPKPVHAFSHSPAWAHDCVADSAVNDWCDTLAGNKLTALTTDQTQLKRLPAGMYVQRLGADDWRAYRQPLELTMRNRRGSDTSNGYGKMENELFSNEQMPVGTSFVADISAPDQDVIPQEWWNMFLGHFSKAPILFIGRGRAPVEIIALTTLGQGPCVDDSNRQNQEEFRLTLISDAIIRNRWLGFHQRLTLQALCDALDECPPEDATAVDVSEARIDRAFNAATRLPRPSVLTLRAGSSIVVRGKGAAELYKKLKPRFAIGERQHEGLGRFRLNLDLLSDKQSSAQTETTAISTEVTELRTESVARYASLAKDYANALKQPSTSQLGNVRARLDAIGPIPPEQTYKRVDEIRQELFAASRRTRAAKAFQKIAQKKGDKLSDEKRAEKDGPLQQLIGHAKKKQWSIEDIRLAWRLMLSRTPRRMDNEDPDEITIDDDQNQVEVQS